MAILQNGEILSIKEVPFQREVLSKLEKEVIHNYSFKPYIKENNRNDHEQLKKLPGKIVQVFANSNSKVMLPYFLVDISG